MHANFFLSIRPHGWSEKSSGNYRCSIQLINLLPIFTEKVNRESRFATLPSTSHGDLWSQRGLKVKTSSWGLSAGDFSIISIGLFNRGGQLVKSHWMRLSAVPREWILMYRTASVSCWYVVAYVHEQATHSSLFQLACVSVTLLLSQIWLHHRSLSNSCIFLSSECVILSVCSWMAMSDDGEPLEDMNGCCLFDELGCCSSYMSKSSLESFSSYSSLLDLNCRVRQLVFWHSQSSRFEKQRSGLSGPDWRNSKI